MTLSCVSHGNCYHWQLISVSSLFINLFSLSVQKGFLLIILRSVFTWPYVCKQTNQPKLQFMFLHQSSKSISEVIFTSRAAVLEMDIYDCRQASGQNINPHLKSTSFQKNSLLLFNLNELIYENYILNRKFFIFLLFKVVTIKMLDTTEILRPVLIVWCSLRDRLLENVWRVRRNTNDISCYRKFREIIMQS